MTGLEKKEEHPMEHQATKLAEAIQQLQHRIEDIELQIVPSNLQDVRDQREDIDWSTIKRIRALSLECK